MYQPCNAMAYQPGEAVVHQPNNVSALSTMVRLLPSCQTRLCNNTLQSSSLTRHYHHDCRSTITLMPYEILMSYILGVGIIVSALLRVKLATGCTATG